MRATIFHCQNVILANVITLQANDVTVNKMS